MQMSPDDYGLAGRLADRQAEALRRSSTDERHIRPLDEKLQMIQKSLAELVEVTASVEDRLQPVLRVAVQKDPIVAGKAFGQNGESQLMEKLASMLTAIQANTQALANIRDRIEL